MGANASACTPCCGAPDEQASTVSGARPVGGGGAPSIPQKPPGTPSFRVPEMTPLRQQAEFDRKYQMLEVIGMGSTSVVHHCRDRLTRQDYACKIINKKQMAIRDGEQLLEQFQNEISVLMMLQQTHQHPNIIHLEDVYITDRKIFMVMEFVRGGELFDYVIKRGKLSESEASDMLQKIFSAVSYMHNQGIVHRDLKPENLLLTRGPHPDIKLIDFGLSKMLPTAEVTTHSFLGTRGYLAPEMLKRQAYTKSVDMWALGVIAFILLCGCLPFDDDSAKINDETARHKFVLRFPGWAQNLSADAKYLLSRLLDTDPRTRMTAAEAAEHPWVLGTTTPKNALLASPRHLQKVPKTPKRYVPDTKGRYENNRARYEENATQRNGPGGQEAAPAGIGAAIGREAPF